MTVRDDRPAEIRTEGGAGRFVLTDHGGGFFGRAPERITAAELEAEIKAEANGVVPNCPHGAPLGDCDACDVASDQAYDAAREGGVR